MKQLLFFLLLLGYGLQAQPLQPAAKRFWRAGDYVRVDNLAGTSPETYDSRNVSVMAFKGITIRVMISGASDYYSPAQFLNEAGQPYGATAAEAVSAWGQTSPVISGTGVAGVSSINGKTGAVNTVVETTGSYNNPSWISGIDATKITESTTRRFLSDGKISQYDGYSTQINTAITAAGSATSTANTALTNANTALTAAGSVTATVASHTTQINSVSATASTASTNASAALSGVSSATATANTALTTANTALSAASSATTAVGSVTATANTALANANTAITTANSATTALGSKAPLASPTFSGTVTIPAIPSLALNDSTKKPAPSDFVKQNIQAAATSAVNQAVRRALDSLSQYVAPFDSVYFKLIDRSGTSVISPIVSAWPSSTAVGGGSVTVDQALSLASTNAISNAAATAALNSIIGATLTPVISGFSASNVTSGGLTLNWNTTQKGVTTGDLQTQLSTKADASTVSGKLDKASNLSDLASAATSRANLGLGSIATLAAPSGIVVGTTDPQTLTNKSLSGASNTFSNIPADALIDGTTNKVYTGTEKTKLAGIATGATANSTDAFLLSRANHTGTAPFTSVSGVATPAQIGSGTPAAGKYVDGATGAWTTLPTATVPLVYYISPTGSDSNDGKTPATAWATTAKIVALTPFVPGTTFRFQGGATFTANLELYQAQSGTAAAPVVFESYGGGKAILQADGSVANSFGIYMENVSYLTFQNLIVKGINNVTTDGIYVGNGAGNNTLLQGLKFLNCEVYGFTKGSGFYSFFVGATCGFKNMVVEGCSFHDDLNGFLIAGNERAINSPNINDGLIVRRCIAYNNRGSLTVTSHSGSGFIMGFVTNGLIEFCEAYGNGSQNGSSSGGPYGIWMYECINSTIQSCESHHNFTKTSNNDGGGFDIDGGCQGCIIQYCYSHDNEGPGFVIVQFTGAVSNQNNNTIRYNISQNDVRANLQGSLMVYNVTHAGNKLHNNVIYVGTKGAKSGTPYVILTGGASTSSTSIQNNIFIADGSTVTMKYGTTSEVYSNNYYYYLNAGVNNFSTGGTVGNPGLQSPGNARTVGVYSTGTLQGYLDEYKLVTGAAAINAGATMVTPTLDFYNNTAPIGTRDIGVHEYQ